MNPSVVGKALVVASVLIPIISASRWEANLGWCRDGSVERLYEGDFNGDGRTDLLCHRVGNGYKWIAFADANGQFTGTNWEQDLGWCWHPSGELHIGDFNGDGRSDLLCHDTTTGHKWIAHANSAGNFADSTTWEKALGWCWHSGGELHIGDFNGDRKDDMLCHDSNNGYKWISLANPDGNFADSTSWEAAMGWCWHDGAELHIGDFDGNGRDDMLCHDTNTGYKWIAYIGGARWEQGIGWCWHDGASLHIGDVNGDGKDDMVCHDTNGYKWVALANDQNNFSGSTSWEAGLGWCWHPSGQFFLGDYNGDSRVDMLCHDTSNGYKWVIYASDQFYV